jgi:predicted dehydrogenase
MPNMEIYGTEGSLRVPDPNTFGGPVLFCRKGTKEWKEIPLLYGYAENSRGFGVADIAHALADNKKNRASGELTRHVVAVMSGLLTAAQEKRQVSIEHSCKRPEAR